jgi:hypothetical protein
MNGEYRWVRYTITAIDDGFYVHWWHVYVSGVSGPYGTVASAHAGARKLIDEMLRPQLDWLTCLGVIIITTLLVGSFFVLHGGV